MHRTLYLVAALMLTTPLLVGQATAASTALPQAGPAQAAAIDGSIVQKAGWRRCVRWGRKCTYRWGWRTWRYNRCMFRHGC